MKHTLHSKQCAESFLHIMSPILQNKKTEIKKLETTEVSQVAKEELELELRYIQFQGPKSSPPGYVSS